MKRFVFPLDRVLRFRRLEMERTEAELNALAFRVDAARRTAKERRSQAAQSRRELLERGELRGADFRATDLWVARLETERNAALGASEKLAERHRQVLGELIQARRKVKLVEMLRKRKLTAHARSLGQQLEAQAAEFHLAKLIREKQR
jgi:hypothetical protein